MKKLKLALLMLVVSCLSACAGTTITSIKNTELTSNRYSKILIFANFTDISSRKLTEEGFVKQFKLSGFTAVPSIELFPPVKEYTEQEIFETLERNNIDGSLIITAQGAKTEQTVIPRSSYSYQHGTGMVGGTPFMYSGHSMGGRGGSYKLFQTQVSFDISLFDNKLRKIAWIASSVSKDSYGLTTTPNVNKIVKLLAKKVVKKLIEDDVVIK